MEIDYRIKFSDLVPFKGIDEYHQRTLHLRGTELDKDKLDEVSSRGIALSIYNSLFLAATVLSFSFGLEKLLK